MKKNLKVGAEVSFSSRKGYVLGRRGNRALVVFIPSWNEILGEPGAVPFFAKVPMNKLQFHRMECREFTGRAITSVSDYYTRHRGGVPEYLQSVDMIWEVMDYTDSLIFPHKIVTDSKFDETIRDIKTDLLKNHAFVSYGGGVKK